MRAQAPDGRLEPERIQKLRFHLGGLLCSPGFAAASPASRHVCRLRAAAPSLHAFAEGRLQRFGPLIVNCLSPELRLHLGRLGACAQAATAGGG